MSEQDRLQEDLRQHLDGSTDDAHDAITDARNQYRRVHAAPTRGGLLADRVAGFMGSWRFIVIQTVVVAAWITLNSVALLRHWDPWPFILLNLLFSTQAAYAAPVIMMSQNRASALDHTRDDFEAAEVDLLLGLMRQMRTVVLGTRGEAADIHLLTTAIHDTVTLSQRTLDILSAQSAHRSQLHWYFNHTTYGGVVPEALLVLAVSAAGIGRGLRVDFDDASAPRVRSAGLVEVADLPRMHYDEVSDAWVRGRWPVISEFLDALQQARGDVA